MTSSSSSMTERVRAALPGYEIDGEIARGGFGVVLLGTHLRLQRKVAVKVLPAEVAADADIRRRFAAEARIMADIDHPHVVRIYDYVEDEDLCLFVMEYLPAGTVQSRLSSPGFDATSAIAVALACASALDAAHSKGVLHRDVKPANLMFADNGTIKLTDFGIAKIAAGDGSKTRAGDILGTAWYIAPEQVLGHEITPATDIYALSTMLYQLLAGMLPFPPQEDSQTMFLLHAFSQPTPLSSVASSVPSGVADVVMRGLATDPNERWFSAEEFGVALAGAASQAWGPNWLTQAGIPVVGNDSIQAASAAISNPPALSAIPMGPIPWSSNAPPAPPLLRTGGPVVDDGLTSPRVPYILAAVLAIAGIALAFLGLGTPPRGGDLKPGIVTIAGVDPVTTGEVEIDMSKPIRVTVTGIPGDSAALAQNVVGYTLGNHDAPLTPDGPSLTTELPGPLNPFIMAGKMTGELRITNGDNTTASYRFGIRSTQPAATTGFAAAVVFLGLFAAAYVESYTRALRRGRNQISAKLGLPFATAALAVSIVGAVWVVLGREPTAATLASCAAIGAAAGVCTVIAVTRHGRINRYRRGLRTPRPTGGGGTSGARRTDTDGGTSGARRQNTGDGGTSGARRTDTGGNSGTSGGSPRWPATGGAISQRG
jgi:serine/threonine protein kinase